MRALENLAIVALLSAALATSAACDNHPAEGKPQATVQELDNKQPPQPTAAALTGASTSYAFSQANSKLEFVGAKITGKHDGAFKTFSGKIQMRDAAAGPTAGAVNVEIEVASISADVEKLTNHLKSPELLDAAQFPKARFTSTSVTAQKESSYLVTGTFELHGVTKQISFPATIRAEADKVDADAEFAINRKDFGIVYPGKPDDLIQDDVLIKLTIRAARAS